MTGFWISQICVRGSKVADATLTFQRGLNVLSGGSDTGKSYLLGCIRYMMGGEEPPDSIPLTRTMSICSWRSTHMKVRHLRLSEA